ncbi:MAG: SCO family protein [Steroidobacteraceae bacterium]
MNAPDSTATAHRRRGRSQLILLAALFFLPLLVAFWLYYGAGGWRPVGSTNKGDLLDPAIPLPPAALMQPDGAATSPDFLRSGKWTIAYLGDGACDERCRKALYLSRQSHIALNKDMDRVQRVFLVTAHCCDGDYLRTEHPDLLIARLGDDPESQALLARFPVLGGEPPAAAGRTYVIDPLGNLVLSYPPGAPDKALLTDVKKLLRLSHIG